MTPFAFHLVLALSIATILLAATSLTISAWRSGGLKHDLLMVKRATRKIVKQIRSDVNLHPTK